MIKFGQRSVIKQGGSYMISLPMIWMKSTNPEMKTVTIEMDSDNTLRIAACDIREDMTYPNNI